jgi:hypothetical protein
MHGRKEGSILIIVIFLVLLMAGVVTAIMLSSKAEKARRDKYGIPSSAHLVPYQSGLAGIAPGNVYVWRDEEGIQFVGQLNGTKRTIPLDRIVSLQYNQDIQTYSTGGGRSISGAVVGMAVAGTVGAIVGGRSKSKTKTVDRSTVNLRVKTDAGVEIDIIFQGGQTSYQALSSLLGAGL